MKIGEVLNAVYDEEVGWRPSSGSIKPVHVANGLVRALSGRYFNTRRVVEFLVWWKRGKVPDEARRYEALVHDDPTGVFTAFEGDPRRFERVRKYALGILAADRAVFPSADMSSLSLTCQQMASRDHNDHGLGEFAATLLRGPSSEGLLAQEVLRATTVDLPDDPVTATVWPLLEASGKEPKRFEQMPRALKRRHHAAYLAQLNLAAESLATHEKSQGNRLRTLQRVVHFVCLATHAHAQALAANGVLNKRPPGLIAVSGHKGSHIALASEASLLRIYDQFEEWLAERLAERITAGKPLSGDECFPEITADGRRVRRLFAAIGAAGKKDEVEVDPDTLDARMASFTQARQRLSRGDGNRVSALTTEESARIIAHALVASYLVEYESGGPREFLQGLCRKAGLLFPHFQGRSKEKRILPSVPILDVLVRSCVPARDLIPLDDFLEHLWMRFGLIVGGRKAKQDDDVHILSRNGIDVDPGTLARNTGEFVDLLVSMGLARRFADNVTFIGDGHAA